MANNAYESDLKQQVLYGGSFGPTQIDQLRDAIGRDMKNFDELKEAVNELKTKDPDELSPAAYVKLGVCQYLIGKYKDSLASLQKGDGGALAYFYFAKLHLVDKSYEEAIDAYNTAQKAGYNSDVCALGRAEAYREMNKLQQSLQELDCLSGAIEQTAEYLYQRAATVNAHGDSAEAIALYERAVQVDPEHPGALYGLALENERRGNDEEALKLYQRSAMRFPTNIGTLMNLGILYEDMEDYESAKNCFQRVLEAEPMNPRARLFMKDVLATADMCIDDDADRNKLKTDEAKRLLLANFELTVRARNCLNEMGVVTLGDLCKYSEADLLNRRNFGETSLTEVKKILKENGLSLGMNPPEKQQNDVVDVAKLSPQEQETRGRRIEELALSVRAKKCMTRLNIVTIGQLVAKSADDLLECKNFGVTSLKEIREKLANFNLKLRGE